MNEFVHVVLKKGADDFQEYQADDKTKLPTKLLSVSQLILPCFLLLENDSSTANLEIFEYIFF